MDIDRFGISEIVRHYTKEHQVDQAKEELIELIDALDEDDGMHMAEEMADVLVMIVQLMMYMHINPGMVESIMDYKISRQIRRIENASIDNGETPGSMKDAFNKLGKALAGISE